MGNASEDINDLPPPTAPDSIPFSMRNFASEEGANHTATKLAFYIRLISRYLDLSRLDGVTVAYEYDVALAELDRGVEGLRPLTRSNDDQLIGVGMAKGPMKAAMNAKAKAKAPAKSAMKGPSTETGLSIGLLVLHPSCEWIP